MTTILSLNQNRAFDLNGFSIPGAMATFYDSGTTRIRTVFTDPACELPHPPMILADGAGVFPPIYDTGEGNAAVAVTDKNGVMLAGYPIDPVPAVSTNQTGAAAISFDPTPEIPEKTVQKAIERVQRNIVEPLADFGLGVTGNGPLITDIDAINRASGFYRYDDTTAGTFPANVNKADGGIVGLLRETGTAAQMLLFPAKSLRVHRRRLAVTWQEWGWLMSSTDTAEASVWVGGTSTAPTTATPAAIKAAIEGTTLGLGQQWRNVLSARDRNAVYRNETGRPIMVAVQAQNGEGEVSPTGGTTGWIVVAVAHQNTDGRQFQSFIVPPGHRYRWTGSGSLYTWSELR